MRRLTREVRPVEGTYLECLKGKQELRDYLGRYANSCNDAIHVTSIEPFMKLGAMIYGNAVSQNKEWMPFVLPVSPIEIENIVQELDELAIKQDVRVTFGRHLDPLTRAYVERLPLGVGMVDPGPIFDNPYTSVILAYCTELLDAIEKAMEIAQGNVSEGDSDED